MQSAATQELHNADRTPDDADRGAGHGIPRHREPGLSESREPLQPGTCRAGRRGTRAPATTVAVATADQAADLELRIGAIERQLARLGETPSGWLRARDLPVSPRRLRRLRESGELQGYRLAGGRELVYRAADVEALIEPVHVEVTEALAPIAECDDGADYAERHLRLIAEGGRRG